MPTTTTAAACLQEMKDYVIKISIPFLLNNKTRAATKMYYVNNNRIIWRQNWYIYYITINDNKEY